MVEIPIKMHIQNLAKQAYEAVRPLALISIDQKTQVLEAIGQQLNERVEEIIKGNQKDLDFIPKDWSTDEYRKARDRITVTEETVQEMARMVSDIAHEPDPTGEVTNGWMTPDGLQVNRVRVPIGVIAVISEYGPVVSVESIAMCLRSGNVCLLRGGKEWFWTNLAVVKVIQEVVIQYGIPEKALTFIDRRESEGVLDLSLIHI